VNRCKYSHWNCTKDAGICSEPQIPILIGGVTCTKWLVSLQHSIFIIYDSKILFTIYTDTIVHIQIEPMTEVSSLNNIYYDIVYDTGMLLT
jgi:hypothetical protein